jgi:hypothetical protein
MWRGRILGMGHPTQLNPLFLNCKKFSFAIKSWYSKTLSLFWRLEKQTADFQLFLLLLPSLSVEPLLWSEQPVVQSAKEVAGCLRDQRSTPEPLLLFR